ncbi:MAG: cupin-like domain-containing protein [Myxococcales bacterium]|nr:cupin-like domain-containing protein [Myxococcales bacterium]MCB9749043.1 cupin-like domain-containing protein [Myxococcales bacterium]
MVGEESRSADADAPLTLSRAWRVWAAENLLRGVSRAELLAGLMAQDVPRAEAEARLDELTRSPAFAAATALARRVQQLELVLELQSRLAEESPDGDAVERRRDAVAPDEFYRRYYAGNTPVVLGRFADGWPALTRWRPEYFKDRFGDVEIEVASGRAGAPDPDINFQRHRETVTMAAYVDRVLALGASNDLYAIANNRNTARAGLQPLWEDIAPPPGYLDAARLPGASALWFGPAGTITPLHHDTSNILFVQILGRKRIYLGPPRSRALLATARGVYNHADCERLDAGARRDAGVRELVLAPGETLFIPVGWWHQVRALELSVSLGLNNLRRPNTYDWYKPGALAG